MGFFFEDPLKKYEGLNGKWTKAKLVQYFNEFAKSKIQGGLTKKVLAEKLVEALDTLFSKSAGEPEKVLKEFLVTYGWNFEAKYKAEVPNEDESPSAGAWQKPVISDNVLHLGIRASNLTILQALLRLPKSASLLEHKNSENRSPIELACMLDQEQFSITVTYEILSALASPKHVKMQKVSCELALNMYTIRLIPEGVEMVFKVKNYKQLFVLSYHALHVERVKCVGGLLCVKKEEDGTYQNLMNDKNKTKKRSNNQDILKENYLIQETMRDETTDKVVVQKIFTYYIRAMNTPSLRLRETYQVLRQALRENNKVVVDACFNNVPTVDANTTLLLDENLSSLMFSVLHSYDYPEITWDLIDFLIMSGAIMNFTDGRGDTCLHIIARKCFKLQTLIKDKSFKEIEAVDTNGDGEIDENDEVEESYAAKLNRLKQIRDRLIIRQANLVLENADGETPIKILTRSMSREEFFNLVRIAYNGDVHALSFRFILLKNIPNKFRQVKKLLKDQVNEINPKMGSGAGHTRDLSNLSTNSRSSTYGSNNSMTSRDSFVVPKDNKKKFRGKSFSIKYDFQGRFFPVTSDNRGILDAELKEAYEHPIEKCFLNFFFPISNMRRAAWFYLFQNFDPIGFVFVLIIFILSIVASLCLLVSGILLALWSLGYAFALMFSTLFLNIFYYLVNGCCSCKCDLKTCCNCISCIFSYLCCCCIKCFKCCFMKKQEEEEKEDDLVIHVGVEMTDSLRQSYKAYGNMGLGQHESDGRSTAYLSHEFEYVYALPSGLITHESASDEYEVAEESIQTSLQHSSMNPFYIFSQWRATISGTVTRLKDSRRSNVSCVLKEVQIKNVAFAGENGILNGFLEADDCPVKLFLDPAVQAVIDYKWRKWAYTVHVIEMLLHIVNIAAFTTYVYELHNPENPYFSESRFDYEDYTTLANRAATLTFLLLLRNMRYEVIDIFNTPFLTWISNIFNIIDTAKFLVFGWILWSQNQTLTTRLLSIEALLLWSKMLHFMKGFKATGALISMIVATAAEVGAFLLLLVFIFASFASAFYSMFRTSDLEEWSTPFLVFLNLLGCLMGEVPGDAVYDSDEQILAAVILLLFMVIVVIIMLNLLISIVSKVFETTYEEKDAEFSRGKGEIIDEIESAYNINKRDRTWFPEKLYLITKVDDRPEDGLDYDETLDTLNSPRLGIPSLNLKSGIDGLFQGVTTQLGLNEEPNGVETQNPISEIQKSDSDPQFESSVEMDNANVKRDQVNADRKEAQILKKVEAEDDLDLEPDMVDVIVDDEGNKRDQSNLMEEVMNQRRASLTSTATTKSNESEVLDLDADLDDESQDSSNNELDESKEGGEY